MRIKGSGFRDLRLRVQDVGSNLGFRVSDLGLRE